MRVCVCVGACVCACNVFACVDKTVTDQYTRADASGWAGRALALPIFCPSY